MLTSNILLRRASLAVVPNNLISSRSLSGNGTRTVTLIPGDGIGPEIAQAVQRIFAAAEVPVDWEPVDVTPVKNPDGTMGIPKVKSSRQSFEGNFYLQRKRSPMPAKSCCCCVVVVVGKKFKIEV